MSKPKRERSLPDNEAKAVARMLRVSPQKLNLVAQMIRGRKASLALADLQFSRKRIAVDVKKCLESAIANAENNHELDVDDLVVSARVHVDEVVAFVASIERECRAWTRSSPSPVVRRRWNDAIADATTVKDAGQQQRLSGLRRARRVSQHRRMAAFAGVALVAAALATAVGLRVSVTTKNVAEAAEPLGAATSPALPRCEAASWESAPIILPIAK